MYVFYQDGERSIAKKLTTLDLYGTFFVRTYFRIRVHLPTGSDTGKHRRLLLTAPPETLQTAPEKVWVVSPYRPPKYRALRLSPPTKAEPAAKPTGSTQTEVPVIESPTEEPDTVESEAETPVRTLTGRASHGRRIRRRKTLSTEPSQAEEPPTEERSAAEKLVQNPHRQRNLPQKEALPMEEPAGENKQTENETKRRFPHARSSAANCAFFRKNSGFSPIIAFLLHGYHNYNHLLLVEEDGHYWLGVPSIYDTHEARAASLFGFPQFTRSYTEILDLEDEERKRPSRFRTLVPLYQMVPFISWYKRFA